MATYLFTWNPKRWQWNNLFELVEEVNGYGSTVRRWSCGNTKKIRPGDRAFLIRLGEEPKGIMASGNVEAGPYVGEHWDGAKAEAGRTALYVDIEFDVLLNPESEPILPRSRLKKPPFTDMYWDAQSSGTTIPVHVAEVLEQEWINFLGLRSGTTVNGVAEPQKHYEGAAREVRLTRYERNPNARKRCLEYYGMSCCVCGFSFSETYGEIGSGFIHVHHLTPLSEIGEEYEIDPNRDMRPVCPNCHAVIHRRRPPYSIEEMKEMIERTKHST